MTNSKSTNFSARKMTTVAVMGVLSLLLMMISVPLPFVAPNFMQMDLSDVPALICGFALGPLEGVLVVLIKNVLHLFTGLNPTGGVGELSNFIVGSVFVLITSNIYKGNKTKKSAIKSLFIGVLGMTLAASFSNYYLIYPFYAQMIPMDKIIEMGSKIFTKVNDLFTMIVYCVVPFNLIKGLIVSLVTSLIYKPLSPIIKNKR